MNKLLILTTMFVATLFCTVEASNLKDLGKKADKKIEQAGNWTKKTGKKAAHTAKKTGKKAAHSVKKGAKKVEDKLN